MKLEDIKYTQPKTEPYWKGLVHFKNNPVIAITLEDLGFEKFGPGHCSENGYRLFVKRDPVRICLFLDNRIYPVSEGKYVEFRVTDHGEKIVSETKYIFFGLIPYKKIYKPAIRGEIYKEFITYELTKEKILELIEFSKQLP